MTNWQRPAVAPPQGKGEPLDESGARLGGCERSAAYLETANPGNVEIYRHKGFALVAEDAREGINVYYMVKRPEE